MIKRIGAATTALLLVLFGALALASPAQAHHSGNPNTQDLDHVVASHDSSCGEASVTLTVPEGIDSAWQYRLQVEVDGEVYGTTDLVIGPGTSTLPLSFGEGEGDGSVDITYYFIDATEWDVIDADMDYQSDWPNVGDAFKLFTVDTDCAPEPCEWSPDLLASDEECVEPTPDPDPTPTPAPTPEESDAETLPVTGSSSTLLVVGGLLVGLGIIAVVAIALWRRYVVAATTRIR